MIIPAQGLRIVLAVRPVDFRCGHDALAGLVQNTLGLDPHSGLIVVFRSKRADRLKILLWDGTGLVLVYKRLGDGGHFEWPRISDGVMRLTRTQFEALFDGGNPVLHAMLSDTADALCVARAVKSAQKLRCFRMLRYSAKSWGCERRFVARIEATPKGLDIRYVATSLKGGARYLYEKVYCARGEAENFIKLHKSQLASDRTSCRNPLANQFRLIIHTSAYWLMHGAREAMPRHSPLARAEFATIRLQLIKVAARVVEGVARIRVSLPSAYPHAALLRHLAGRFTAAPP